MNRIIIVANFSLHLSGLFVLYLLIPPAIGLNKSSVLQPTFASEPSDKRAILGDTIVLPCRVLNKAGVLQWTRDDFGLGHQRSLDGFPRYQMIGSDEEGDFSLQITNVNFEDEAVFQCQVAPSAPGIAKLRSRFARVTVLARPDPPKITPPDHLKTVAGKSVELTCECSNGKPAAEVRKEKFLFAYTSEKR